IGMITVALFTPIIGNFALNFQSIEFFWLAIFGVIISGTLTAPKDPLKGWISGFFGLAIAMIGMEGIHAHVRFNFGIFELSGGIRLIPAMVGAFGFAEVIMMMKHQTVEIIKSDIKRVVPRPKEVFKYWKTIIRSGLIGTFIGAIPGVGEDIGAWVSYDFARRASKESEKFGHGSIEGLIASETGNNAAVGGAIIPVLSLAIPGSAPAAVLLAAMYIHGVRPGPLIMVENPQFVYSVVAMFLFATLAMFILGLSMVKTLVKVLEVPRSKLMPVVLVLCVIGAYAVESRHFDIIIMAIFGILGYVMQELDYPVAPMVLGIILGDILDKNLRRALVVTDGSFVPFFTRPISIVLIFFILLSIFSKMRWFNLFMGSIKGAIKGMFVKKKN
ncbi:MAG: tripartite tricarboxylate transporter permease, partial [Sphaerochaetaceae bacterium]|nr:tripartite tricarboxylate transporter permease [Sphaerochaetaceae bacterium]